LTLKQFLEHPDIRRIYNLPSRYEQIPLNEIPRYSEIYARADDPSLGPRNDPDRIKIGEVSRTGFSNYMREKHYWPRQYLNIRPLQPSPQDPVTAGYGWSIVNDRINNTYRVLNSYRPYPERDEPYQNYENWVEVQVSSKGKEYSVTSLSFGEKFGWSMALIALNIGIAMGIKWEEFLSIPVVGWLIWIGVTAFFTGLFTGAIASLIVGIKFDGDVDELTEGSPISVRVTRHKRDASYGIWNFRYGNLTAVADACTYRESKDPAQGTTIEPVFDFDLIGIISGRYGTRPFSGWFKTSRHLFETRLNYTE
jgi:hypothetical protein